MRDHGNPAAIGDGIDRIPPNSLEAEMALIGAVLVDREMLDVAREHVGSDLDFYAPMHATLWASILALDERREPIDTVSLAEDLRSRGMLDKVGGMAYVSSLTGAVPSIASTSYYAKLVHEKARLRRAIAAGLQIVRIAFDGEHDPESAFARIDDCYRAATDDAGGVGSTVSVSEVAQRYENDRAAHRTEPSITLPWQRVNDLLGGTMAGELIVWPGKPAAGKSGALSMVALWTAQQYGDERGAFAVFAYENGVTRTVQRFLALLTGISARRQRLGILDKGEASTLIHARRTQLERVPLYVFGGEQRTLDSMRSALRTLHRKHGAISGFVVDHVGKVAPLAKSTAQRGGTRHQEMSDIYEAIIGLAQTYACPAHVVQHFNRAESDEPSLDSLRNIRDGGNPEGHADAIIVVHRPTPDSAIAYEREAARFAVLKSRDGDVGSVDMRYIGHRNMFLQAGEDQAWFDLLSSRESATQESLDAAALFGG